MWFCHYTVLTLIVAQTKNILAKPRSVNASPAQPSPPTPPSTGHNIFLLTCALYVVIALKLL